MDEIPPTFVDIGSLPLSSHTFQSDNLNKESRRLYSAMPGAVQYTGSVTAGPETNTDHATQEKVYFQLNQEGTIFYSGTSTEMSPKSSDLCSKVKSLRQAMQTVIKKFGYDNVLSEPLVKMIGASGCFTESSSFDRQISIKSNSVEINTQIITSLFPSFTSNPFLDIAKNVISSISGSFGPSSENTDAKFSHVILYIEEIGGISEATLKLLYGSKKDYDTVSSSSPCHKAASSDFIFTIHTRAYTFFDSPEISQFIDCKDMDGLVSHLTDAFKNYVGINNTGDSDNMEGDQQQQQQQQ